MRAFLERRIDAETYRREFFSMSRKRTLLSDEASRIIQKAYGDADDYDSTVRLPHTIEEPRLRELVADSSRELEALGHHLEE
jgi:hypothetical protein